MSESKSNKSWYQNQTERSKKYIPPKVRCCTCKVLKRKEDFYTTEKHKCIECSKAYQNNRLNKIRDKYQELPQQIECKGCNILKSKEEFYRTNHKKCKKCLREYQMSRYTYILS